MGNEYFLYARQKCNKIDVYYYVQGIVALSKLPSPERLESKLRSIISPVEFFNPTLYDTQSDFQFTCFSKRDITAILFLKDSVKTSSYSFDRWTIGTKVILCEDYIKTIPNTTTVDNLGELLKFPDVVYDGNKFYFVE